MSLSFWRNLSTPAKQLILLLLLALLLLGFLIPLGVISMQQVQSCLDNELYYQTLALRRWFIEEGYYLRDEAKLLADFDAFEGMLSTHDAVQIRRLMALYQRTHNADGLYLITSDNIYTSSSVPPLSEDVVRGLDIVRLGFNGQTTTEMVTLGQQIWFMSVAPHLQNDGGIDGVFLIVRKIDASFLEDLSRGLNGAIVITDGQTVVKSHPRDIPISVANALNRALESQAEDVLQPFTTHYDGERYRVLVAPLMTTHSSAYAIAVAKNAELVTRSMMVTTGWGLLFGLICVVLAIMLVQFHAVEIFRPLKSLVASTKQIAAGQLDEPLEPTGVAEVYELSLHFEAMRSRLKELLERERSLSENLEMQVKETSQALDDVCRAREDLLAQLISSQEEERRRISRELHDETSQELANIIVRLGALSRMVDDEELLSQLQMLRNQAATTLEGVNRIVMDLRPGLLDEYGLVPAVKWYAEARLTTRGIATQVRITGRPRELSSYAQASIYRVIQEAINNIAQHSQAKQVEINISWKEDHLQVEIIDDGQGFNLESICGGDSGHYGLLGMRERIILLGGVMDIQTRPGEGARVTFQIPYNLNMGRKDDAH